MLCGHTRHQQCRNPRAVSERLVEKIAPGRKDLHRLAFAHHLSGVDRAEMLRHLLGMMRLVVARIIKPDREGPYGRAVFLKQCGHDGGIDTARKEHADGHVGDHAQLEGVRHQGLQFVGHDLFTRLLIGAETVKHVPVPLQRWLTGARQLQDVSWRKLGNVLVDASGLDDVAEPEEIRQRGAVDARLPVRVGTQRLQFGAEPQGSAVPAVVQRLDPQPVSDQRQLAMFRVPQGDRKHAEKALHGLEDAPLLKGRKDDLGVTRTAKHIPSRQQLAANIREVVDLAIEDHGKASVGRQHGLMPMLAQVQDGQPGVPQPDLRPPHPRTVVIRTAIAQRRYRPAKIGLADLGRVCRVEVSRDAAHLSSPDLSTDSENPPVVDHQS